MKIRQPSPADRKRAAAIDQYRRVRLVYQSPDMAAVDQVRFVYPEKKFFWKDILVFANIF